MNPASPPPPPPAGHDVTRLLLAWRAGDQAAFDALIPLVYDELRTLDIIPTVRHVVDRYLEDRSTLVLT